MTKKLNKTIDINPKKGINKIKLNKIFTFFIVIITIGAILAIASVIFFPSQESFSELSLLTYNAAEETYEVGNYSDYISRTRNVTIFFMVKNYENKITYYQIQIKATKITQNISLEYPLSLSNSKLMYSNETYEKILSPATKKEKETEAIQTGQYIWGPVNTTLFMNATLDSMLGGYDNLKIVFELWIFNSLIGGFQYTGIFTFLEFTYGW